MKTIFLFNKNGYVHKNNIKKAVSVIGLATGLGIGTMMYTGCQQPTEPTPTGIEQEITDNYTTTLGNGNYVMHNFMFDNNAAGTSAKVDTWLAKAETYMKGLSNGFSDDFKNSTNTNYKNLITKLNDSETYEQSTMSGFDPVINIINNNCKPIFEEIISHVDDATAADQCRFIVYYKSLSNEAYKYGFGKYFDGIKNYQEPQELEYESQKESIISYWTDINQSISETPFDIAYDIETGCTQITEQMDKLFTKHAIAEKMGIAKTDLRKLINLSLNISSLTAMHDETSTTLSTHDSCATSGNTLAKVMEDKLIDNFTQQTTTQNNMGLEY